MKAACGFEGMGPSELKELVLVKVIAVGTKTGELGGPVKRSGAAATQGPPPRRRHINGRPDLLLPSGIVGRIQGAGEEHSGRLCLEAKHRGDRAGQEVIESRRGGPARQAFS